MALEPMYRAKVNSPRAQLLQAINASATTIRVSDLSALPDAPNLATLWVDGMEDEAETIRYTGKNTANSSLTGVTRGFQGTARSWVAGTAIARVPTAYDHDTFVDNVENLSGRAKRTARFVIGTSTAGWTENDVDYLCDGTDDQVEINQAIQGLPSQGGGEIIILDGTYNITAAIYVDKPKISIRGNGVATVLRRMWNSSADEGIIEARSDSCRVEKLVIDGNMSAYPSFYNRGIALRWGMGHTITGNKFKNNSMAITLIDHGHGTITGNTIRGNQHGIVIIDSTRNIVVGNTCFGNATGIVLTYSDGNTIANNFCGDNDVGISLESSNRNTVVGNTCFRFSHDYTESQHTIHVLSNSDYNLVATNYCMGKAPTVEGGVGNSVYGNKWGDGDDLPEAVLVVEELPAL